MKIVGSSPRALGRGCPSANALVRECVRIVSKIDAHRLACPSSCHDRQAQAGWVGAVAVDMPGRRRAGQDNEVVPIGSGQSQADEMAMLEEI